MSDRLAEIRARADAATPGPWHGDHDNLGPGYYYGCVAVGDYGWVCAGEHSPEYDVDSEQGHADAEFIAHARQDIPHLLDLLDRVRAAIGEHRTSQGPAGMVPVWAIEQAIDGGEG